MKHYAAPQHPFLPSRQHSYGVFMRCPEAAADVNRHKALVCANRQDPHSSITASGTHNTSSLHARSSRQVQRDGHPPERSSPGGLVSTDLARRTTSNTPASTVPASWAAVPLQSALTRSLHAMTARSSIALSSTTSSNPRTCKTLEHVRIPSGEFLFNSCPCVQRRAWTRTVRTRPVPTMQDAFSTLPGAWCEGSGPVFCQAGTQPSGQHGEQPDRRAGRAINCALQPPPVLARSSRIRCRCCPDPALQNSTVRDVVILGAFPMPSSVLRRGRQRALQQRTRGAVPPSPVPPPALRWTRPVARCARPLDLWPSVRQPVLARWLCGRGSGRDLRPQRSVGRR